MKNNKFYIIIALPVFWMSSQVYSQNNTGVGTANPQAKLHVDGASNNSTAGAPTAAQQADDFVVLSSGNVGVGTATPSVKLEVISTGTVTVPKTALKINDGNEGVGKVLSSDTNGNSSWKYVAINEIRGVLSTQGVDLPFDTKTDYYSTGCYIDLGPGRWRVSVTILLATQDFQLPAAAWSWVRSTFSLGNSTTQSVHVEQPSLVSGMYKGPQLKNGLLTGSIIINNKSTQSLRYYYIVGNTISGNLGSGRSFKFRAVGSSVYGENLITAFPIL